MRRRWKAVVGAVLLAVPAVVLGGIAPAGAAPAVSVSPAADLADGESVTVTWAGFAPAPVMAVSICWGPVLEFKCGMQGQSISGTSGTTPFVARAEQTSITGASVDCRAAGVECAVTVLGVSDLGAEFAGMPISFVPAPPLPVLRARFGFGAEDLGTSYFEFRLDRPAVEPVVFAYRTTRAGTATAGSDFVVSSGYATIPAGSRSAVVSIPILNDEDAEPLEYFSVRAIVALHATVAGDHPSGRVWIVDDE